MMTGDCEQLLLFSRDRMVNRDFLDVIPDAIIICDAAGTIRQVNRAFTAMFGYIEDELLGQPVERLMPAHLRDRHCAHRAGYQNAPRPRAMSETGTFVGVDKAGREIPIDIMLTPIPHADERLFMAAIRDMTKQKRLEGELAQQCAELKKSQAALFHQNALFDAALNNMTHGLAMFDATGRLLVSNDKFREIYVISKAERIIAMTWGEIIGMLIGKGIIGKDATQALGTSRRLVSASGEGSVDLELADGRTIKISHREMEDGGCVAVHCDITDRLRAESEIRRLATHDFLTGLPNRLFLEQMISDLRRGRPPAPMLALHYLDLDRFKQVNDDFGHRFGDLLLQAVANRLSQIVPSEDFIARIGGDEFVIVQPAVADSAPAVSLATRIIASLSEPFRLHGKKVQIGASIGLAFSSGRPGLVDLLRQADLALYEAKQNGKGLVRVFASPQLAHRRRSHHIERRLMGAIARNEMLLHFQPIVDCRTGRVNGFEALLRWFDPHMGPIGPSEFIPIAEQTGVIVPIGLWVLEKACLTAADWPAGLRVAVNVSPLQFAQADFVNSVEAILHRTGFAGHRLELEVTESCLFRRDEAIMRGLAALRELGIGISADDFGTGYSSLHQLQDFPFNVIKIDRSFVSGDTTKSAEIVRAIAGLAKGLRMKTIAEGVETQEQHALVLSAGCEEIQGNLIAAPMSTDLIPNFLRRCEISRGAA
jgi:diguanylate cyclase (GGDEF)-like protein/PAS domain S-box-containing protein